MVFKYWAYDALNFFVLIDGPWKVLVMPPPPLPWKVWLMSPPLPWKVLLRPPPPLEGLVDASPPPLEGFRRFG